MARGAKPGKAKGEGKRPVARKSSKNEGSRVRDLEKRLAEALEQQAATSEILRVISRSPTDVQPVFQTIVDSAKRLLGAFSVTVAQRVGDELYLAALSSVTEASDAVVRDSFPVPIEDTSSAGPIRPFITSILSRKPVVVTDAQTQPDIDEMQREVARARGFRGQLVVPMLREQHAIGVIGVTRREAGGFTQDETALLQTFADQAVIAIENVRLFNETKKALEQQTATSEILRVIASSWSDLQLVFDTILQNAVRLCGALNGFIWRVDDGLRQQVSYAGVISTEWEAIARGTQSGPPTRESVSGWVLIERTVLHVRDLEQEDRFPRSREMARAMGYRSLLAVPLLRNEDPVGAIVLHKAEPFEDSAVALLQTFADQAVIAIENVRLFRELEAANRELGAASRHKSEFLANMSHELRTPLNAVIGFSEVLLQRMFGDLNTKQDEYLKDIYASGQHLLSLINDILDLSKIEAGRMELEPADFDLSSAIDNALILVRERATRRRITLGCHLDEGLGTIRGDERKVKQVLLNLLSNALKFTPEGGRIDVRAALHGGVTEVSVADTGVGIAPEDQAAVFEEFRQVGTADKKVEGTGLGLALSQKFVQLHGGRLWVESELGRGATFIFTLPVS